MGAVVVVVVLLGLTVREALAIHRVTSFPVRLESGTKVTLPLSESANVWAAGSPEGP